AWSVEILQSAAKHGVLKEARLASTAKQQEQAVRRLQMSVLEDGKTIQYLHFSRPYEITVWIGRREGSLAGAPFPEQSLPWEEDGYLLTVTLFAPGFTEQPIVETVYLPRASDSTSCSFSFATDAATARFEGRITIAYLTRILQTYLLTADVTHPDSPLGRPLELVPEMATQGQWLGLDFQMPYGASLVVNRMQNKHQAMVQ